MEEEARKFNAEVISRVIKEVKEIFSNQGIQEELVEKIKNYWEYRMAQY
jgi:hypothetical protein